MHNASATIILDNKDALRVVASSGRISTQEGTALDIFAKSLGDEKDIRLVKKVLASGHKSVVEHQSLSVAFNDVSVLVEQFLIEFRLASFTVKSRRYVNFQNAGYVVPEGLDEGLEEVYRTRMNTLFGLYGRLMEIGIPKEDARFVLPYAFRSNFYVTANAREWINIISSMLYGRGRRFDELRLLGQSLKEQFDSLYPGVIEAEKGTYENCRVEELPSAFSAGNVLAGNAKLISAPQNGCALVQSAMKFAGREMPMCELTTDARPRELEMLQYVFLVENSSLSCMTHFARHRIQSPLFTHPVHALAKGNYVLPQSIASNFEALALYRAAFEGQAAFANAMLEGGLSKENCAYLALSGHVCDILMAMNARELLHFFKLRTCERAQWEIRAIAEKMLALLQKVEPDIFDYFGASCAVTGKCPEGRLSCGNPRKRKGEAK